MNALLNRVDSIFYCHILLKVVVKNAVNEVGAVAVSSLLDLLQSTKVIEPEELGHSFDLIESS